MINKIYKFIDIVLRELVTGPISPSAEMSLSTENALGKGICYIKQVELIVLSNKVLPRS